MSGRWCGDLGERCKRSQRLHSISRADHAAGLRDPPPSTRMRIFADLDPPQTFALRADEILGNEWQMVWRSGRALQARKISNEDFANFDPPQTFALSADEILGNERQMVCVEIWASAASVASTCNSISRADHAALGRATAALTCPRPPS